MRRIKWPFLVLLALSFSVASGVAHAATVHVRFAVGATEISPLNDEVPFYTNHKGHAANIPAEMAGLSQQQLMDERYEKFRRMGSFFTEPIL